MCIHDLRHHGEIFKPLSNFETNRRFYSKSQRGLFGFIINNLLENTILKLDTEENIHSKNVQTIFFRTFLD